MNKLAFFSTERGDIESPYLTLKAHRGTHDVRATPLIILRLLLVLAAVSSTSGCNSHMYYAEAKIVAAAVTEELVRLRACANHQACHAAQMVLWEGGGWKLGPLQGGGVSVEVYNISDGTVAAALVERCRKLHAQTPTVPVSIVVHANAHIDNLHPGRAVIVQEARFE